MSKRTKKTGVFKRLREKVRRWSGLEWRRHDRICGMMHRASRESDGEMYRQRSQWARRKRGYQLKCRTNTKRGFAWFCRRWEKEYGQRQCATAYQSSYTDIVPVRFFQCPAREPEAG